MSPSAALRRLRGRVTSEADPDPSLEAGVTLVASALALAVAGGGGRAGAAQAPWTAPTGEPGGGAWRSRLRQAGCAAVDVLRVEFPIVIVALAVNTSFWKVQGSKWFLPDIPEPSTVAVCFFLSLPPRKKRGESLEKNNI